MYRFHVYLMKGQGSLFSVKCYTSREKYTM